MYLNNNLILKFDIKKIVVYTDGNWCLRFFRTTTPKPPSTYLPVFSGTYKKKKNYERWKEIRVGIALKYRTNLTITENVSINVYGKNEFKALQLLRVGC